MCFRLNPVYRLNPLYWSQCFLVVYFLDWKTQNTSYAPLIVKKTAPSGGLFLLKTFTLPGGDGGVFYIEPIYLLGRFDMWHVMWHHDTCLDLLYSFDVTPLLRDLIWLHFFDIICIDVIPAFTDVIWDAIFWCHEV